MKDVEAFMTAQAPVAPAVCTRRQWLYGAATALGALAAPVWAGAQLEEPLADSVRSALSAAVGDLAPPEPVFASTQARMQYLRWLTAMSDKLQRRMPDWEARRDFLQTLWYEAKRAGVEVDLVLGLVQVESGFRQFAVSVAGARGYMQIMPFWVRVIGDGDASKLFHLQTNLRFGCVILRHYLERERGDMFMALGRYNGSRGKDTYPRLVFGAQKQWRWDAPEMAPL